MKAVHTISDLFLAYEKVSGQRRISRQTVIKNKSALRSVARATYPHGNVENLSTSVLTGELADTFRDVRRAGLDPEVNRAAWDSRSRGVQSTLTQARSIVSGWAMYEYEKKRLLKLPDLTDFRRGGSVQCNDAFFQWPEDTTVIDRTHAAAETLWQEHSDLYLVYLLCYWGAMRAGEAAPARWAWVDAEHARIWIKEGKQVAKQGRIRAMPLGQQTLDRLLWYRRPGAEYILPGASAWQRYMFIERQFTAWMIEQGWTTRKKAHELRRLMGARIYTQHGPAACRDLLGHKRIETVCQYYAALDKLPEPLSP